MSDADRPVVVVCSRCGWAPVAAGAWFNGGPVCERCWEGVLQDGDVFDPDDQEWGDVDE